jgi:dihydrofolate reductase
MGRIIVSENVSLDGITQDPTGEEGYKFGGWFGEMPDAVRAEWAAVEQQEALDATALLLGRDSYRWFAGRWADRPGEWADRLRDIPKYVVSSTLEEATGWGGATILAGDVIEQVTELKQTVDGDIVVYASGRLVHTLMEHDLVDELRLTVHPVVLGTGDRLFRETTDQKPARLAGARTIGGYLVLLTYRCQPVRG